MCEIGCVLSVCVVGLADTGVGVARACVVGTLACVVGTRVARSGFIGECDTGRRSDAACNPLPCFFASPGGMQPLLPGVQPHPVLLPWLHPGGVPPFFFPLALPWLNPPGVLLLAKCE